MMTKYLGVEYIYQDCAEKSRKESSFLQEDIEQLKAQIEKMPCSWIHQLRQAALSAREVKIKNLLAEIPQELSLLAHYLGHKLNHLSFEQIVKLTEGIDYEQS